MPAPVDLATVFARHGPEFLQRHGARLSPHMWRAWRAITTCRSVDGLRWDRMRPLDLPNPDSGIDAQVLADGRALLVYNHSRRGRTPLNLALSRDGWRWQPSAVLEDAPGEYSYPAVIQAADGLIHITYTWQRRRIRHVELDPAEL